MQVGKWSASRSGHLTSTKQSPRKPINEVGLVPEPIWMFFTGISCPYRNSNPGSSSP